LNYGDIVINEEISEVAKRDVVSDELSEAYNILSEDLEVKYPMNAQQQKDIEMIAVISKRIRLNFGFFYRR